MLLFIDNIFRFTQAGSEVSTLLGRMPSAVGYQPTLADEMGQLQERITSTRGHSITSMQAIYVPADDITDPAPHNAFAHLDATTVLSRAITEKGIYPAVDPLDSTSRILDAKYIGQEHYDVAREVQRILQRYKELQDIIAILGIDELVRRGQGHRAAGAADRAVPVPADVRGRAVHRPAGRLRRRSRRRSPRSRRSPRASTTTFPSRRSTWSAGSRTWRRRPGSWSGDLAGRAGGAGPRAVGRRGQDGGRQDHWRATSAC